MATPTDVMTPALASSISDRAFRVLHVLALHMDSGWVPIPPIAELLGMTSHQIRLPLAELRAAGMVEHDRRYEIGDTGRKTWHTYVRLVDDTATEDAA
ncbi:Rrf2 family transcriptional regulator [Streptomyces cahuitamycinicus]|uniref:Uncharacterized protein n=1 Tax=Streptomyces cahuitamycinicus TaxID=2070367 RepID=A0A2N8THW0_9ACTN|nr:Rrf2 family transcriptional regulator [Streptomyces cahuitamycinicus]PNG18593.1 hypothetical protein C1J00_30270 [Streptomyces cahuitamycinicus]